MTYDGWRDGPGRAACTVSGRRRAARLHILGGCRLLTADGVDATPRGAKARALLAYLALSPEGAADRGKAAGLLWSESASAKTSLRQCVKEIRTTLAGAGLRIFTADTHSIRLDLGATWVDALELQRLASSPDPAGLEQLADLHQGALLDCLEVRDPEFDDWLVVERARLRQQVCGALERWLRLSLEAQGPEGARRAAEALLAVEPAHEEAHRVLMRLHAGKGDVAAAIRQYQTCREILARELAVAPSADTEALLQELRAQAFSPATARSPPAGRGLLVRRPAMHAVIAVEPKAAALGDLTDQPLAAALAMSLREALSRIRWLSVVDAGLYFPAGSRDSYGMPGQLPDPTYFVYVSVLRAHDRVRLSAELKDAETARIVWADRHDRVLTDDLFGAADTVARVLAGRLDQEVRLAEIARASCKPVEALSAYDCVLRAIPLIFRLTPDSLAEAEKLLARAQEADPHDSMVYAWRAFWYFLWIGEGWAKDGKLARTELDFFLRRAIEIDPKNAFAHAIAGHARSFVYHSYDRALDSFEQSLRLDPHSAYGWDFSALTFCYTGNAGEALRRLKRYQEIVQHDPYPYFFHATACIAHMFAGNYERAVQFGLKTIRENPNFHAVYRPVIASLGHLGRTEEAHGHLEALRCVEPEFSIGWFRDNYPPLHPDDSARYIEGLRKAGAPEE